MTLRRRELFGAAATLGTAALLPPRLAAATPAGPPFVTGAFPQRRLLRANLSGLLDQRNLAKSVHNRLIIDDMEQDGHWFASDVMQLDYTTERAKSGKRSLRIRTALRNENYIRAARAKNGSFTGSGVLFAGVPFSAFIVKHLSPAQDWRAFNRISLWCYLHPTDNPTNCLSIQFICDGATAGPEDPISVHYWGDLRPGEWNHLVWEIPEYQRDRVSQIVIFQPLSGVSIAGADPDVTYDFDDLALERVDAERVAGWEVTQDKIAYCHIGYQPAAEKLAVAAAGADNFSLLDAVTGKSVANFPAQSIKNHRGDFALLDFSSFSTPGRYRISHGAATSEAFAIDANVWRTMTEATLNAFYGLRCGCAVDHVHDACHLDVYTEYQGDRRVVGGGWHDAANLTQSPYRTHLSIYALLELHESLARQGETALAERALEEARWGLEWSLRCRYAPGLRVLYGQYSYWTDKARKIDDVVQESPNARVGRDSFQNCLAALAAARAARAIKLTNPALAVQLIQVAREDYSNVVSDFSIPTDAPALEINQPSWRDRIAYLTLTAAELFATTSDVQYTHDAARFAALLTQLQERRFVDGIPIAGYFYEDPGRTRIVHEYHNSFEDGALLAFTRLCELLPDHPDWISWYAGLAIYADYFCNAGSGKVAPFGVVPAAVWRRRDLDAPLPPDRTGEMLAKAGSTPIFPTAPTHELISTQMGQMFEAGVDLGHDYRLRVFPLWSDHIRHGATTVHMSKTIGLGAAAQVMGRADLSDLTARQLQWVVGANPLSRSLIYGVGHDFWQNFTGAQCDFVGGMSLGFNSYTDDAPAWGNNAVFPYKEMWVYSSCRIAFNMARVGAPTRVSGRAVAGAVFRNLRTHGTTQVQSGNFDLLMPAGEYEISYGNVTRRLNMAHATERTLDLDPDSALVMGLAVSSRSGSRIDLRLSVSGAGRHQLGVRVFNGKATGLPDQIDLASGGSKTVDFSIDVSDPAMMWLVALIPNGKQNERTEISGALTPV